MSEASALYQSGQYFKAARYAFAAQEIDPAIAPEAYAWITMGLTRAGLYNSGSYFFVKTLQGGSKAAIRRVLPYTQQLFDHVGPDLLRKYLVRHTTYEDYDGVNRGAYLFSLGKEALLTGDAKRAVEYLGAIPGASPLYPFALQLRGTARAIGGQTAGAIQDFRACADRAEDVAKTVAGEGASGARDALRARHAALEAENLRNRCLAGEARSQYQANRFEEADRAYDRIPKASLVWPDILFEQAWNAFARQEYNRTLGKLVSYKSPALKFVFNTEVDVLRAQAFLALCLYSDANDVVNEFNSKYVKVGEDVKRFTEGNASNLPAFYAAGRKALRSSLTAADDFNRLLNRFVRGPYFQNLADSEIAIAAERAAIRAFDSTQPGVSHAATAGFPGFLDQVLQWRLRSVQELGGAFVKNSLIDYHSALVADFEKMAFIKLEMLGRAKDQLMNRKVVTGERGRGNVEPGRADYQYRWSFNGEFWNDELGDYVFGLESECRS